MKTTARSIRQIAFSVLNMGLTYEFILGEKDYTFVTAISPDKGTGTIISFISAGEHHTTV